MSQRIVEAYVGEYASGKSEVAVNRALALAGAGRQVNLVDLDIVEPCYTLRPIKKELEATGVTVLAWETRDTVGLGEAGNIIKPECRWALYREGDVILDIGYGVEGAKTLNLLEGVENTPELQVFAVINAKRPMTSTLDEIVAYIKELGPVDGLINNTHLGDETTPDIVQEGARLVSQASKLLGIPVVATTADRTVAEQMGPQDCMGHPIRPLVRYMPRTFW
ncbi:ATP synthase [Desulforamulus hydrothermalis]|uniref:ATP synthase n=1 Tax=Desulforamulus hydrothermalis TaxID=412895 RepID=UPI000662A8B1|nr:ATP synthase [Desulforamulus hydrothermalis]